MRTLYWNKGRPVLVDSGLWSVFPPAVLQDNWRRWCRRHEITFACGLPPDQVNGRVKRITELTHDDLVSGWWTP